MLLPLLAGEELLGPSVPLHLLRLLLGDEKLVEGLAIVIEALHVVDDLLGVDHRTLQLLLITLLLRLLAAGVIV